LFFWSWTFGLAVDRTLDRTWSWSTGQRFWPFWVGSEFLFWCGFRIRFGCLRLVLSFGYI